VQIGLKSSFAGHPTGKVRSTAGRITTRQQLPAPEHHRRGGRASQTNAAAPIMDACSFFAIGSIIASEPRMLGMGAVNAVPFALGCARLRFRRLALRLKSEA
jgi:hypothetical protein